MFLPLQQSWGLTSRASQPMEVLQQAGFSPRLSPSSYLLSLTDLPLIIYLQRTSEEMEAKSFSFGEFWAFWPCQCRISQPPLSEAVHILLTRPFTHQLKPETALTASNNDSTNSRLCTYPPSFHPLWLIKYLLFSKQIMSVNLQSSATSLIPLCYLSPEYKGQLISSTTARPGLSAFTPAAVPGLSLCFGLIWRTRENNGEKRVSKGKNCLELISHQSTKKSFSPSLQWGTNLAHGSLRLSPISGAVSEAWHLQRATPTS